MYKFNVVTNEQLTRSTLLLTVKISLGERAFVFQPGQYAGISFYRHGRPTPMRCFSIVSSPTQEGILQFSMRAKGHFTRAVAKLAPGDEVDIAGPFGGFVLHDQRDVKTALIAGGIGVTPFMSMIRYAAIARLPNELRLILSCQSQDDIPFVDELRYLETINPHFKVVFFIGQGPIDSLVGEHVYTGRISPEILDQVAGKVYDDKSFFVCGAPAFMKSMIKQLRDLGAPSNRIMTEAFSQGPNRQTGKIRSWPINIYFMGAIGMVMGSFIILVVDLFKTLPASSILETAKPAPTAYSTNSRQADLDQLVNNLAASTNTAPPSTAALIASRPVAVAAAPSPVPTTSAAPVTRKAASTAASSPAPSAATTVSIPTPAPAPAPAPKPAPAPVCTTSPSGVKTCI